MYPFGSQRRLYSTFDQNLDIEIRRYHLKTFLECRVYESVDVRSLSLVISPKSTESSSQWANGYIIWLQ